MAIAIPDIAEQRRVAEILEALDDRIRASERVVAKVQSVKVGLIEGLLGLAEHRGPLREITDLQVGFAFSSTDFLDGAEGVRLLRGENVGYGSPDWSEQRSLATTAAGLGREYELQTGDIVVGMDRTFTKSGMRISVLSASDTPSLLVQRVGRFIPRSVSRQYLRCVLESEGYQRSLRASQKGMDIPHLSKVEILSPVVPMAEPVLQRQLANAADSLRRQMQTETLTIARLRMLRDALRADLLAGRVRVPESAMS